MSASGSSHDTATIRIGRGLAILLIVTGALGLLASFELTVERIALLTDPDHAVACDMSVLVQCSANMTSWQGSVFGFSNPLLGLMTFPIVLVVGVAALAGVRFPKWFLACFSLGMAFAFGFVTWLISQSIFSLGTLCPWCMAVWSVTIPAFYYTVLYTLKSGAWPIGSGGQRFFSAAYEYAWVLTVVSYFLVVLLAQLELNAFARL